ncbi:MAG TPA: hypothetical protein VEO74_07430 [Thermoanaerobaculia bacterium]|nr:hypothetical protein [Thermoanaerobaculia bacterium]
MRREDILAYVNRDWRGIARHKERFWAERKKQMTPTEVLALADDLRVEMLSRRPDWPSAEERRADLETHARVSEMLRSVCQTTGR